jgi:lambda family phage tail tape measure protein
MATNIQLNVTGNAQQQLDAIDKKVSSLSKNFQRMGQDLGTLNGVFSRLGTILSGIALTNFGMNALKAADDVNDLSEAIGVTVAEIKNLQAAFAASGGDADGASTALIRLSKAVAEARQGNEGLRKTFEEVGVSQAMLARGNLSEILRQTFAGMEQLGPSVDRTATSMELLGKTNNTLNFEKVNQQLDANIGKYKELEPYLVAQGNLYENIKKIGKDYSESLGKDTQGLVEKFAQLTENTKAIADALNTLTKIAVAFGAAFLIFGKIIPYLSTVGGLIAGMGGSTGFLATQMALLGKSFQAIFVNLAKVIPQLAAFFGLTTRFGGLSSFLFALKALASFALRFAGLAGILYGVATAVDFVIEKLTGFSIFDWISEKASFLMDKLKGLLRMVGVLGEEEKKPPAPATATPGAPAAPTTGTGTLEASKQQIGLQNAIQNVTKAYREQAAERVQSLQNELKFFDLSEDAAELEKNRLAIEKERDKALADLAQKEKEILADTELSKTAKGALLAEIYRQKDAVKIVAEEEKKNTEESIIGIQKRKAAIDDLKKSVEDMSRAFAFSEEISDLQDRLNLIGLTGDALERQTAMLKIEKDYRTELMRIAQEMHKLEIDRIKLGEEAYQKELARLQEQINMANKLRDAKITGYDQEKAKTKEVQGDFVGGWNQALEDYVKNSQDKSKQAGDLFTTMTQGLEEAFVNFAKTGKLSFNDLINTIVESILRSQIQNLISTIFQPLQAGGGGIFGTILGSIFGKRANGGPVSDNKPYMVGEKGPELFVPNSAGNIVPNNQLNSNAAQMSAPVTNNYITNNISALDSKSVAQLFAENRKTLLGTVQMAQRELP